jgi:hypothetical protein
MLRGGDLRSIGRSEEVVQAVLENPFLFGEVVSEMVNDDPVIRMRASDAVEKITIKRPDLLAPFKDFILTKVSAIEQKEVRWHVAQILPRLDLTNDEVKDATEILKSYLDDESNIVRVFTIDALAHFVEISPEMHPWVLAMIEDMVEDGSPSIKSRGKKLLTRLKKH